MAVVKDPGAEILGGDDLPEAAIDPNAPQIRVSHEYSKLHMLIFLFIRINHILSEP